MRTLLLLVLTCIVVTDSIAADTKKILLEESIESAKILMHSKKIPHRFVKNVIGPHSCSGQRLCQVVKVLKEVHLKDEVLMVKKSLERQLSGYAGKNSTCNVTTSEECTMEQLLRNTLKCCQHLYIKLLQSKKTM
ncbi:interleukin-4 [Paramisgurnus dabryanus]|uniref:interleukin-4 n=1 Tax=Paramisgurnus dabryanus TaxID=90735 RepID=UPI003CCF831C